MAKIKGWNKVRDNEWNHISSRINSGYDKRGNLYPHNFVRIYKEGIYWRIQNKDGDYLSSTYKSEAIKEAVRYMKSHPNG
ncbi:MAG: hypothetical protein KKD01_19535 [Proteobacteria bacterium]|nr:hypothetical protein [Pseudomonadota bacterium]